MNANASTRSRAASRRVLTPQKSVAWGLDQIGIELMLADDLAAAVVNRTTAIFVVRLRR